MSDTNKERDAFEAWYSAKCSSAPKLFGKYQDPEDPSAWLYLERAVDDAWFVWQGARAILALAPGLSGWQEIASAPKNRKVIVGYFNQLGKHRTVMASYYPAETLESEHTDSGWADEGWYEECESQSETIMPTDCEPTHWMPLPAAPGIAPHQPQPEPTSKGDDVAYRYACTLAQAIFDSEYASDPDYASGRVKWGLCDSTAGVLTQIDNMVSGMTRKPSSQQREPQEAAEQVELMADTLVRVNGGSRLLPEGTRLIVGGAA